MKPPQAPAGKENALQDDSKQRFRRASRPSKMCATAALRMQHGTTGCRTLICTLAVATSLICVIQLFMIHVIRCCSSGLAFSVQSPAEIQAASIMQVHANTLYQVLNHTHEHIPVEARAVSVRCYSLRTLVQMPSRAPTTDGVLDPRLGVSSKRAQCATCGQTLKDCAGHFGIVKLPVPVFHPVRLQAVDT